MPAAAQKTSPVTIPIHNIGKVGIVLDVPGHQLPPEAWTNSNNMRFREGNSTKFRGHTQTFGTPTVAPSFHLNVPAQTQSYWLYPSLTKCYVYEGGVHTNTTRQTAAVDVNYTAANHRDWNGGIFGGIPILNNGSDIPQYWSAISVGTRLSNLLNWPSTMRAKVVRPFGAYLVALNITDSGALHPQMFWWSHRSDPGTIPSSWDYTDPTKEAGRKELTDIKGGDILDGMLLGNFLVIYKETSTHVIQVVGGQEIMANDLILPDTGILATRCVTPYSDGKGHFVVTADGFLVHSGQKNSGEQLFDARVRRTVMAEIDSTNFRNSFCFTNQPENEVWFCYPTNGQTHPNKALIWNWKFNTPQFRDFVGYWASSGPIQDVSPETWNTTVGTWDADTEQWATQDRRRVIVADPTSSKFYKLEDGETFAGSNVSSFVERTGLAIIGRDREGNPKVDFDHRKMGVRIWPKVSGTALITVRMGGQEDRNGAVTWNNTGVFNPATDKFIDLVGSGRLLAIRFETTGVLPWTLEGYDMEVTMLGVH